MFEWVTEFYFGILTTLFGPVLALPGWMAEAIIATMLIFITTMMYKYMADQDKIKELRDQQKEINKKAKEYQKTDPEKANKLMGEALKLTNKQMRMNMKPMVASLVIFMVFFPWLRETFLDRVLIELPFWVPLFGTDLGWLGFYIVMSLPISMGLRKAMGVN
jgi:uncharacterized membrane protein (DUF106 family)